MVIPGVNFEYFWSRTLVGMMLSCHPANTYQCTELNITERTQYLRIAEFFHIF